MQIKQNKQNEERKQRHTSLPLRATKVCWILNYDTSEVSPAIQSNSH